MAKKVGNKVHQRGGPILIEEAAKLGEGIKWKFPNEKKFWERWSTEKYGGVKARMGKQVGGQMPMKGPDIIKYIMQHDKDNSSGAIKKALEISQKLQDNGTKPKDLLSSIRPLQSILGGGLYSAMKAAGGASKSQEKVEEEKPEEDLLSTLIDAAMQCAGEYADEAADLLNGPEINKIKEALHSGGIYVPVNPAMPQSFVDCINKLLPTYYDIQGATS